MNTPVNDDTLIAYLDAELDPAGMDAVERALDTNAALRQRLQQLVRADDLLRSTYAPVAEEAVPPQLVQAILAAPAPGSAAPDRPAAAPRRTAGAAGGGSGLAGWLARWCSSGTGPWMPTALASVAALGVGLWLGVVQAPGGREEVLAEQQPVADRALLVALESLPSGRLVEAAGRQIEVLASFEHRDGRICREFNSSEREGDATDHLGLACRAAGGGWTLAVLASERRPADGSGYRTASDRQHETLDRYRQQHTLGQPLEPAAEQALMARNWQR